GRLDARDDERDLFRDPLRIGRALAGRPVGERLVAETYHAAVPGPVLVDLGVDVHVAELVAQQLDVGGRAGEEQPAGAGLVHLRVFPELRGRILLGLDGDRIEE